MLGAYSSATGGNMEESGSNITDGSALPIRTSNIYIGLAQKTFVFASAADAIFWASLQVAPNCIVYDPDDDQVASLDCTYEIQDSTVIISAIFTSRVNTQGATGLQRSYFFRFVDITGDIPPQGVSLYH